ncbi:MAG: hypothetical protein WCW34_01475 [Patescibacteria group bacterium]
MTCDINQGTVRVASDKSQQLTEQFDAQVEALLRSRILTIAQMSEQYFVSLVEPLRSLLADIRPVEQGHTILIGIPQGLVSIVAQCAAICIDGRNVKTWLNERRLGRASGSAPPCLPYLAVGIDLGGDYPPMSGRECLKCQTESGQSSFFAEDFLALLRCRPKLQPDKYMCANTRYGTEVKGAEETTYFQVESEKLRLLAQESDYSDLGFHYPSCQSRFDINGKPMLLDGSPASLD